MKRKLLAALLAACTALSLSGTALAAPADEAAAAEAQRQQMLADLFVERADIVGLTQEQRLEDYDYMWETLENCFPYWGVLQRRGIDLAALRQKYRGMLEEYPGDFALYSAVNSVLYSLGGEGHLMFFNTATLDAFREAYAYIDETADPQLKARLVPWLEALNDDETAESYRKFGEVEALLNAAAPGGGAPAEVEPAPNISAAALPGGTMYIKIDQMLNDYAEDQKILFNLYERAGKLGCTDLIFDITENSGGDTRYWENLIVAPNIDAPKSYRSTLVFQNRGNNLPFLETTLAPGDFKPIAQMPDLPRFEKADRARMTHFISETATVRPLEEGKKRFDGRIWVLTGPMVYSSSEAFAIFCKQTGFATLVGERTGGDGFGVDPVYCTLPNSRIMFRYSMFAGLNPDGSNNEEYGTSPDIAKLTKETALDACLRAIANRRAREQK